MNKMTLPAGLCTFCNQDFMHCNCDSFYPSSQIIQDKDTFLYFDNFGQVWRLIPNYDVYIPLRIVLERGK